MPASQRLPPFPPPDIRITRTPHTSICPTTYFLFRFYIFRTYNCVYIHIMFPYPTHARCLPQQHKRLPPSPPRPRAYLLHRAQPIYHTAFFTTRPTTPPISPQQRKPVPLSPSRLSRLSPFSPISSAEHPRPHKQNHAPDNRVRVFYFACKYIPFRLLYN